MGRKPSIPPGYAKVRILCLKTNRIFEELKAFQAIVKPHEERIEFNKFGLRFILDLKDYTGNPTTTVKNILYDTVIAYGMFINNFSIEAQFPNTFGGEKYNFLKDATKGILPKQNTATAKLPQKTEGKRGGYVYTLTSGNKTVKGSLILLNINQITPKMDFAINVLKNIAEQQTDREEEAHRSIEKVKEIYDSYAEDRSILFETVKNFMDAKKKKRRK